MVEIGCCHHLLTFFLNLLEGDNRLLPMSRFVLQKFYYKEKRKKYGDEFFFHENL